MAEKQNTPEIRFEGFTDPWEQRKLREVASIKTGPFGSLLHAEDYVVDGIPIVTTEHFKSGFLPDEKAGLPQVSESDRARLEQYSAIEGDILFSRVGSVDVNAQVTTAQSGWLFSGRVLRARPTVSVISPNYLHYELSTDDVKRSIINRAVGGTMASINTEILEDTEISFPRSRTEQLEIGRSLGNLDSLITLHQRKYDKLCTVKKSMLDKMFPKPGETEPEIRFGGFTDPWEQRKLGELLLERNEQAPQSDQYPLMAFIANQGIAPKGNRYDRSALVNDVEGKLYKRTEKGDFIYSSNNLETGSIGLNKYGNACISPVYSIFQPSGIADSDFLGRRLVRKDFIHEMVKWRQGVIYGQWRIHEADFLRLNIVVPSVNEQRLIGKLLDNLDSLITLHQRKLELLRNIKKSLLDRMFV